MLRHTTKKFIYISLLVSVGLKKHAPLASFCRDTYFLHPTTSLLNSLHGREDFYIKIETCNLDFEIRFRSQLTCRQYIQYLFLEGNTSTASSVANRTIQQDGGLDIEFLSRWWTGLLQSVVKRSVALRNLCSEAD